MNRLARLKEILWIIATFGLVSIVLRLFGGLGAATALSDAMPWGLWKILNMIAGVALATGGFVLAATVYVFNLQKYRPVLRPAILIAFLGYGCSCFALMLDIGLPHTIWHPLFYWNHHSFLFEVAWCVMLYFSVTFLEITPVIIEKYNYPRLCHWLHKITIPIVILGITFSTLHHTSLGSLFLVMPARMHALWFTMWLPALFFFSAIGAGILMVIFVCLTYSYFFNKKENMEILTGLAKAAAVILAMFLVLKIADLIRRDSLHLLWSGSWESYFFLGELFLATLVPIVVIAIPSLRQKPGWLAIASSCGVVGLILGRLNVGIVAIYRTSDVAYFPTLSEISLSLGIVAGAALVFIFLVENFKIFEPAETKAISPAPSLQSRLANAWSKSFLSNQARITFLINFSVLLALICFGTGAFAGIALQDTPVRAPKGINPDRSILEINGDTDSDFVHFPHKLHQEKLGDSDSCKKCHHLNQPNDYSSSCYKCHSDMFQTASIFDHIYHQEKLGGNWSCTECHDPSIPKTRSNSKACFECHAKDMGMDKTVAASGYFNAHSYMDAMHGLCIECHKQRAVQQNNSEIGQCSNCHQQGLHDRKQY